MATTLSEFRKKYPQYDHVDDDTLSQKLHEKYYSHVDYETFASKFMDGRDPVQQEQVAARQSEPQEPAPEKLTTRQIHDEIKRAADIAAANREMDHGFYGSPQEAIAAQRNTDPDTAAGIKMTEFVNSDQYSAEELGISQAAFDLKKKKTPEPLTAEEIENERRRSEYYAISVHAPAEAEAQYPDIYAQEVERLQPPAETELDPARKDKTWGSYWGKNIVLGTENMFEGYKLSHAAAARGELSDRLFGQEILANMEREYDDLAPEIKEILQRTAEARGQSVEEMSEQTVASMLRVAEREAGSLQAILENVKELEASKPISADTTTLGHYADLLIQNSTQAGYILAGMLLRSPAITMSAMGTEIYGKEYGARRLHGRTHDEAHMDALSAVVIEGVTEGVPVSRALKVIKQGKRGKLGRMAEIGATEFSQEVLAEAAAIGYDMGVIGEDITLGEAFGRLTDAGVVGMAMGTVMTAPAVAVMDADLQTARENLRDAKKGLDSVTRRVINPAKPVSGDEVRAAQEKHAKAKRELDKVIVERREAQKEKKAKKEAKREAKRQKKLTPVQRKREAAVKRQAETDQTITGRLAEEDIAMADTMEKIGKGEPLAEQDVDSVRTLLDAGYAKILPSGMVAILPAGKARTEAVRKAQEEIEQPPGQEDELIEPLEYTRPPETPPTAMPTKIEPTPYKSPEKRKAELEARVDEKVKDSETRGKIADAIIKAEQEAEMIEQREAEVAAEQEKKKDKDYDLAVQQLRQEDVDVAEGLIAMDEKSISGYEGTRLGDVLRSAYSVLEKEEAKAKEALLDAFWNKPVQGQLFDVSAVLVKGTKDYANAVKVGALKIAKHGLKYGAWSADMIGEFGDNIKPALARIWHDSKKHVRDVVRIAHERFQTGKRKGELKYAPKQYAAGKRIDNLRKQLRRLAKEGEGGRFWYERTGKAILRATGGNRGDARKLAGLLAIYSSGTAVGANLTNALKMWSMYKGGDLKMPRQGTKAGRFGEQDRTAIEWLESNEADEHFVEAFGDKRFPFFQNIMREIDPKNYEVGQGATIDLWMMRAFGYDTATPTSAQFAFGSTEVKNLAEKLGWETQQTQAAIWVAIKARWEFIQREAKEKAVAKGLANWVIGPKGARIFEAANVENEKAIIQIFRDTALSKSINTIEKKLEQSKLDFADYMERHYATISWEAEPSTSLGLNYNKLPLEDKLALQAEIAEILTNPETGREYIAEWLGLLHGADQFVGPGSWNMAVGAATQTQVLAPPKHKMRKGVQVEPNTKDAMNGYAAIVGYLLKQDAVAWHRPFYSKALKASNGIEGIGPTLSPEQTLDFYTSIVRVAEANGIPESIAIDWAPIVMDGAVRVLNFSEVPNRQFHNIIAEAAGNVGIKQTEVFQTDGDMITNDWTVHQRGEQYVESINQNQNPEVQKAFGRAKRKFAKRIAQAHQKYAEKYQASTTGEIKTVPAEAASKAPPKGHLRFRHFSNAKPHIIEVVYFGTGIRGAEHLRKSEQVISAYPDKGFKREVGLGVNEYVIDVPEANIYNASLDPLNLKALAQEPTTFDKDMKPIRFRTDMGKFEAAIKKAGFDAYYIPDASGNMKGQARFFRDLPVMEPGATNEDGSIRVTKPIDMFSDGALKMALAEASGNSRSTIVELTPKEFLDLAKGGKRDAHKMDGIKAALKSGKRMDMIPFLYMDLVMEDGKLVGQIGGHEGRHRARTLIEMGHGDKPMAVRLTSREGGDEVAIRWSTDSRRPEALRTEGQSSLGDLAHSNPMPNIITDSVRSEHLRRNETDTAMASVRSGGRRITVRENELDEYEVREKNGEIYYTDDPDDAIGTARSIYGEGITVDIVDDFGDVIVTEPPAVRPAQTLMLGRRDKVNSPEESASKLEASREFVNELFEETTLNPLTGNRIYNNEVELEIDLRGGEVWGNTIRSFERGTGAGTRGLKFMLDLADKHGVVVNIFAKAYGDVGLSQADLVAWYERSGFVKVNAEHYVRHPQNSTDAPSVSKPPRKTGKQKYGVPLYQAQGIASSFSEQTGIENIIVLESERDLPTEAYNLILLRGWAGRIRGLFRNEVDGPVIYIFAEAAYSQDPNTFGNPDPQVLMETLIHEAMGHFGTRAFLGKNYNKVMDQIIKSMPAAVERERKKAGRDKKLSSMRMSAEEVIAFTAQKELLGLDLSKIEVTMLDRVIAHIRAFLQRMGVIEFTRDDLLNLIFRATNFTQNNTSATLVKRSKIANDMLAASDIMGMVAYHGTPHRFDMFDMDKIGTGEGNQAYGWGLYFAEEPEVAGSYSNLISKRYTGKTVQEIDNSIAIAEEQLSGPPRMSALRELRAQRKMALEASRDPEGHIYEVTTSADELLLDWDIPIVEQPNILKVIEDNYQLEVTLQDAQRRINKLPRYAGRGVTGQDLYETIASNIAPPNTKYTEAQKMASLQLLSYGIPGLKFLDQQSRVSPIKAGGGFIKPALEAIQGKFKQTRNLVLFSTGVIDSVKRDGELVYSKDMGVDTMSEPMASLARERDADPDLDRMLDKIGHHKHNKLDSFKDWWDTHKGRWSRIFEIELLDQFAGIKHAEQDLMIFGEESGYMSVRLTAGIDVMIRSALENGRPVWHPDGSVGIDEGTKALIEILAPIGQNAEMLKMFEAFIVARRAKGLHKEARERLISREEIAAVFRYLRKNKLYGLFDKTQKEMADYKSSILDFAEDAGLIDSSTRSMWERSDHVPFYRILGKDRTGPFAGSRIGQVGKVIQRLRGGTETLQNPLESIVQNIGMLIEASIKNRAMADVVRNFDGTGIITKAPQAETSTALVDMKQIQDMLDEAGVSIDAVGRDMLQGIQKLYSLQAPTADNVFSVQENGHKQYYYVHDPGVMRGLEVNPQRIEWLMKFLRIPKRVLTRAITLMPDFILKNWFRDMWHSWMLARNATVLPFYDSTKGWAHAIAEDKTFKDIMSGGGMFDAGYVNASDPNKTHIAMRKALMGAGRGNILDTPRKLARFYMRIANGAENAHRIAVYQKTLKETGSRKQALFESRDLMDFAVRGANPVIKFLTETVPFWGARVQGLSRTGKGFKEAPLLTLMRGAPIILASVALYAINRDDDRYKGLVEYEKRMYYHFFDVFEKGDHYRLPKPFEVGAIFSSLPEVLTEHILSDQPDKGSAMAHSIYFIVREMLMLSPDIQALNPVFELMINENRFTESPIVTEWEEKLDPTQQFSHNTNMSLKWLAQHMPESAPDFMRSPKKLEHLMRGYFGSMMDYALITSDLLFAKQMGEPPQPSMRYDEMPFVRAFRRDTPARYDKYVEEMYSVLEEADKIYNSINVAEEAGDEEAADRLEAENLELLAAREEMHPARLEVRKINAEIREIYADPDMSPTQKREEIDALLIDRSSIAKDVYDYRPGGKENEYTKNKDEVLDGIIGMTRQEQVDTLLAAELPHAAILVNDIRISNKKLNQV